MTRQLTCTPEGFQYGCRHHSLSGDSLCDHCSAYVLLGVLRFSVPCSSRIAEYVVQQYRFYIFEDIGCLPGVNTVNLAFPLVWMIPVLVGTVLAGYACV